MSSIRPLRDLIVIIEDDVDEVSVGGIHLISDLKEKPATAMVLSVGPGKIDEQGKLHPIEVDEGDKIIFVRNAGHLVKIDGRELRIIPVDSLIGII